MIKQQNFVNKHLPVQTQRNKISKRYSICSHLLKKKLQQCHWRNYGAVIITFRHDLTLHLGAFTVFFAW